MQPRLPEQIFTPPQRADLQTNKLVKGDFSRIKMPTQCLFKSLYLAANPGREQKLKLTIAFKGENGDN